MRATINRGVAVRCTTRIVYLRTNSFILYPKFSLCYTVAAQYYFPSFNNSFTWPTKNLQRLLNLKDVPNSSFSSSNGMEDVCNFDTVI